MPRLPQPTAQGRPAIADVPTASPWHFGAQAFGQLAGFGEEIQKAADTIKKRQDELDLTKADDAYRLRLDGVTRAIAQEPDLSKHRELFDKGIADAQADITKTFPNLSSEARQVLEGAFSKRTTSAAIDTAHLTQKMGVAQVLTDYNQLAESRVARAALSTDPGVAADALNEVDTHRDRNVASGFMDAPSAQKDAEARQDQYWKIVAQQRPRYLLGLDGGNGLMAMDPAKRQEYRNLAANTIRMNEMEAEQKAKQNEKAMQELRHQTDRDLSAQYFLSLEHPGDPKYPAPTLTQIAEKMQKGELDGSVGRAMMNMMYENAKADVLRGDNSTYWDLFNRIVLPWGHPNKLTDMTDIYYEAAQRKLTPGNVRQLREDFEKSRTETGHSLLEDRKVFLESMKSSITHSNLLLGKLDQEGDINFGRFTKMAMDEEARMIKDNRNPHDLYSEQSPDFLGKKLGPYRKSLQQSIKTVTEGLRQAPTITEKGGTPPDKQRKPGETPQQYLERMKK